MPSGAIKAIAAFLAIIAFFICFTLLSSGINRTSTSSSTTINTITNTIGAQTYNPTNEISGVAAVYPNATSSTFFCSSNSDCVDVHTQYCFNNLASQQACISRTYSDSYESYYSSYRAKGSIICAMYFIDANASCACINRGCSLVYTPISPR